MNRRIASLFVLMALFIVNSARAEDVTVYRFQLDNGIRVVIVQVPDAPRQAMFTFLPVTMTGDDANRAQWAHLVEHMLLRVTDPLRLSFQGLQLNGETMHNSMRLETFAEPAKWVMALERHHRWLIARQLDPAALEREKIAIQSEEQSTAGTGFTSKFAIAAWNQVVVHGVKHAAVHGDVASADFHAVQDYVATHVPVDDSVLIATIGPEDVACAANEIERLYGGLETTRAVPHVTEHALSLAGSLQGTWDMPTRHVMWWWPLPDQSVATLAAATCVSQAIMMQGQMSADLKKLAKATLTYPCVPVPWTGPDGKQGGAVMMIDCCLHDGVLPEDAWKVIKEIVDGFAEGGSRRGVLGMVGPMMIQSLMPKPDFKAIRSQLKPPMRGNAEGVWLLGQMNLEYTWGTPCEEVIAALMHIDAASLKSVLDQVLTQEPGKLVLEPAQANAVGPAKVDGPK